MAKVFFVHYPYSIDCFDKDTLVFVIANMSPLVAESWLKYWLHVFLEQEAYESIRAIKQTINRKMGESDIGISNALSLGIISTS